MYTSHEDIGYDFEDDPKDKKTLKPHPNIDGGWAWMVVLSSFFVHILIMGSQMALGVLNVEWLEEFHQSRGLTAWVSSLSMGLTLIVVKPTHIEIYETNSYPVGDTKPEGLKDISFLGSELHMGNAIISFLVGMDFASFLQMVPISNHFNTLAGWTAAFVMAFEIILGPFIGLFINTCGCRRTAIIGGLVNSLGWVLSAYAANVRYLFITFGVTAGFGSGMAYLPAVVMVGRYFQKRRALAQGLSTTGTGFGTFLMTVLLKYLCAEYGWRNAMIIQGAVSLNLCVCGALMRPLSPGKDQKDPVGRDPQILPAHSIESVKTGGQWGRADEKEGHPGPEENLGELVGQVCQEETGHRKNMCAFRVLKMVSQLTMRVRKGFQDWYSGYFGAASLFTNRVFVAFIFWALFAYSSFVIPFIHLPEIVNLYNLSEQNDVFPLTSIIAIVHIFGKVILGIVADSPCISVWNVFLMANFTLVLSIFILPLTHTYAGLAVVCALIGFSSGYFSLMPVVTEDLVGIEHLANAYGIIICANGISALLGPPFAGWIYDITQKYDFSFYVCGLLYLVGIFFLLIQPCIQMVEQSRKKSVGGAHA